MVSSALCKQTISCVLICTVFFTFLVIDTLNCAFCQEASLQASLLDASDLAATSPPSELYLSVRNPLGSIENSPEIGATPLRATRVRRRLADNISFRESLKNDSADDKPTDNEKTPVRDHVIENDLECKKVDLMSGLRGGLERVAAGILGKLYLLYTREKL